MLKGKVMVGLGEGQKFMEMIGYKKQFENILHGSPFPGTLNVKVNPDSKKIFLMSMPKQIIHGFTLGSRTFDDVEYYSVQIDGLACLLIVPIATRNDDSVAELVSSIQLRERLDLEDGDEIIIHAGWGKP